MQRIHRQRQRRMRLFTDRAIRHGAGLEARHDRLYRLHFIQRDRRHLRTVKFQRAAHSEHRMLAMQHRRICLEFLIVIFPHGLLQRRDRQRIVQMPLLVLTASQPVEAGRHQRRPAFGQCLGMMPADVRIDLGKGHAA